MRKVIPIAGVLALGAAAAGYYFLADDHAVAPQYSLVKAERGAIAKTISASGKLNALVSVSVGSQISGQIKELIVDFNSTVQANQVIGRIDPAAFEAKVGQARAAMSIAKATVLLKEAATARAKAELENAKAVLTSTQADTQKARVSRTDAKLDYDRKAELKRRGVAAASQVDKAKAAFDTSVAQITSAKAKAAAQKSMVAARQAQLAMAHAEVAHARAEVEQRAAALRSSEIDLDHTFIRSPVDGVIIGRNVDVGQTVAASLQAPVLFTIAQDLRKMQVETSVDEADIGQIKTEQRAKFTVDSFPDVEFEGRVTQIRKQSREIQNVITYTVIVAADNPDLRLLPGMTANVQFIVYERQNVLKVANAAFRFRPPDGAPKADAVTTNAANANGTSVEVTENRDANRRARAARRLDRLTRRLELDESQKERFAQMGEAVRQKNRKLRKSGMERDERRKAIEEMRQQQSKEILAFLQPEQREKYRRLLSNRRDNSIRRGQIWILNDGLPAALSVAMINGDDAFTEVRSNVLRAGQDVIVGIKQEAAGRSAESGMARLLRRFGR